MLKKVFGHFGVTTTNNILNQSHPTQNLVSVCLNKKKKFKKRSVEYCIIVEVLFVARKSPQF